MGGGGADAYNSSHINLKPTRGFGYWCWKPQIILQSLEKIKENDILIYADIGCEFIPQYAYKLLSVKDLLMDSNIVCFEVGFKERQYTKGDIFSHFNAIDKAEYTDTWQIKTGGIFIKKTEKSIEIIKEWLDIFYNHFELATDSKSITPNYPEFVENRHDQSIFSMLMKKHKCKAMKDYYNNPEIVGIIDSRKKESIPSNWGLSAKWENTPLWKMKAMIVVYMLTAKIGFTKNIRHKYKDIIKQLKYLISINKS